MTHLSLVGEHDVSEVVQPEWVFPKTSVPREEVAELPVEVQQKHHWTRAPSLLRLVFCLSNEPPLGNWF